MVRRAGLALFALGLTLLTGCVERRFRVESTPPGAMVYVNNVPYGQTPIDVPFVYYGTYNLTLYKEGFQTKQIAQKISQPWYQYPPIDFVSESVWPMQITDLRNFHYDLEPTIAPNIDKLRSDAVELRSRGKDLPPPRFPELEKSSQPAERPRRTEPKQLDPQEPEPKGFAPKKDPPLPKIPGE